MRRSTTIGVAVALVVAAVAFGAYRVSSGSTRGDRPNVLVIMTDDQTLEDMRWLPNVTNMIGKAGTTFRDYAVSFPNCCPSRATYLTGQYSHNDGVQDNVPPDGGFLKLKGAHTLPVWMHKAGYDTASFGKYLNGWGEDGNIEPPPGWDHWYGLIDPTTYHYFDYDVSVDGVRTHFGSRPEDYSTDVLARAVTGYLTKRHAAGDKKPFFLSFTPLAPHVASHEVGNGQNLSLLYPVPAPRYKGYLPDVLPPRTASYDQRDVSRLPQIERMPSLTPSTVKYIKAYYEAEAETLLAVNDAVAGIMNTLAKTGDLAHTVVLFTSDNGLFHGEHRIPWGKFYLYEPSVHLPLFIRGGPFTAGAVVDQAAGNVDLAPTILALAHAKASGLKMDGRDLASFVGHPQLDAGRGVLLENHRSGGKLYTWGIRTPRWKFLDDESGEKELYDLKADPDETRNVAGLIPYAHVQAELSNRADALKACAGATCEFSDASGR